MAAFNRIRGEDIILLDPPLPLFLRDTAELCGSLHETTICESFLLLSDVQLILFWQAKSVAVCATEGHVPH